MQPLPGNTLQPAFFEGKSFIRKIDPDQLQAVLGRRPSAEEPGMVGVEITVREVKTRLQTDAPSDYGCEFATSSADALSAEFSGGVGALVGSTAILWIASTVKTGRTTGGNPIRAALD